MWYGLILAAFSCGLAVLLNLFMAGVLLFLVVWCSSDFVVFICVWL